MRYFDPARGRPGLPEDVAALVEAITPEGIVLALVNTNPLVGRAVVVQAGGFGEHAFLEVQPADAPDSPSVLVNSRLMQVNLGPWSQVRLRLKMDRYVNPPRYAYPWGSE